MPRIAARRAFASLALTVALAACTVQTTLGQGAYASYRNTAGPIYTTAALPIARLLGTWRQVASFGAAPPCQRPSRPAPLQMTIAATPQGQPSVQYDLCLGTQRQHGSGVLASAGAPGRYLLPELAAPLWVLWIDEANRSMALGTPSGQFGMILSKGQIPADRLRAAREVLAWNGYDLTQFYQH